MFLVSPKFLLGFIESSIGVITSRPWAKLRLHSTRGLAVRIPYSQLVIELDKLMFGGKIENEQQALERADTIEVYLEATGWTWDMILAIDSEETVCSRTEN
jgi:hypothetical protein